MKQRIVVTGGAGFVGKHLVDLLVQSGAEVVVLDNLSRGSNFNLDATLYRVDVGLPDVCRQHFRGADIIFNLAAWVAGVIYNQNNHVEMFANNVRLQSTPIAIANELEIPVFLNVSSVCVYGEGRTSPAVERGMPTGEPVRANAGYSWSKRTGEYMLSWADRIGRRVTVRPSNIYGPNDYFDERAHVIPALIKKAMHDDEIILHGDGKEIREFIYVKDVVHGMIEVATQPGSGSFTYNLGTQAHGRGPDSIVSIVELAECVRRLCDVEHKPIKTTPGKDGGDRIRYSDSTSIVENTNWHAKYDLEDGLSETIEWYKKKYVK